MASESGATKTATEYIQGHLTNYTVNYSGSTIHMDTVITSWLLGAVAFGLLWLASRAVQKEGVPGKVQAFVELVYDFVDGQVKDMFSGDRRFITGVCFTVFVWILVMNMVKFVPVDFLGLFTHLFAPHWKPVATADLNTTLALSLSVILLVIVLSIKAKSFGGYMHELFCTPFHGPNIVAIIILAPFNFVFQMIELISKPLSLALRLYGNMYAGEIIFLLISLLSAAGIGGVFFGGLLHAGWAIFHILVVPLQAFIFMMLTAVYLAMAHEAH